MERVNPQGELERYTNLLMNNKGKDIDDNISLFSESMIAIYNFRKHSTLVGKDQEQKLLEQMRLQINKLERKENLTGEQKFRIERYKTDFYYVEKSTKEFNEYTEGQQEKTPCKKNLKRKTPDNHTTSGKPWTRSQEQNMGTAY